MGGRFLLGRILVSRIDMPTFLLVVRGPQNEEVQAPLAGIQLSRCRLNGVSLVGHGLSHFLFAFSVVGT